jgi:hypothetical protein
LLAIWNEPESFASENLAVLDKAWKLKRKIERFIVVAPRSKLHATRDHEKYEIAAANYYDILAS